MGRQIFSLNVQMEIDSPEIADGESGAQLKVSAESLHSLVTQLRDEQLADIEEFNASEFESAIKKANEINVILAKIEDLVDFDLDEDEDDEE
jgi:hypothetical protein